jgi:G3E family GTPase
LLSTPTILYQQHDQTVSSVGFRLEGEMNMGQLELWLSRLLKDKGTELFRYKGVLAVKGVSTKWIFQVRVCLSACGGWVWVLGSGGGVYTCV